VDGSRIVVADNSDVNGAISQRTITASGSSLDVGSTTEIAANVDLAGTNPCSNQYYDTCSMVVAGGGQTAFLRSDYPRVDQLVTFQGLTQTSSSQLAATYGGALGGSDGSSVLVRRATQNDATYSPATRLFTDAGWHGVDLAAGNVFAPISTIPQIAVRVTSVSTASSTTVPEPSGCAEVRDAQATDSWLMVSCTSSPGQAAADSWGVIDRTSTHASWVDTPVAGLGKRWLGNGFVVRDTGGAVLEWSALEDGTHAWYPLGTWSGADGQLSVNKTGSDRSVAWIDTEGLVHVAQIPVVDRAGGPGAPSAPTVVAGDASAALTWSAPTSDGGSPVTGYEITPAPACPTCTGLSVGGTSSTVQGLANGTAYTFTVAARNAIGTGLASAASLAVTPRSTGTLHLATPTSVLSSRTLASHATVTFALPSSVPSTVIGADLELAITAGTSTAALTTYAAGTTRPSAVNVRVAARANVSAAVVTRVGAGRQVSVYNGSTTAVTLSAVLKAYVTPDLTGSTLHAVRPVTALASRSLAAHGTVTFAVPASLPAAVDGADFVLTASGATAAGSLTVFGAGSARPSAGDLRFTAGSATTALAVSRVGATRSVSVYNSGSSAVTISAVIDAYMTADLTGSTLHLAAPTTVRSPIAIASHGSVTLTLPSSSGPVTSSADLVLSALGATASGTLTVYATDTTQPGAVSMRYVKGATSTGAEVSAVGSGRRVTIYNGGAGTATVSAVLVRWGTPS
jgi:hypothetical protein